MNPIVINRLPVGHNPKIAALLAQMEKLCFPEDPWSAAMFSESMENDAAGFWLAEDLQTQKMIAYGIIYRANAEGDLANIAVLPEYRKKGVGRTLLAKMLQDTANDGTEQLYLEVRKSNFAAQRLYAQFDFQIIGERRNYYRHPREDALVLVRTCPAPNEKPSSNAQ